MSIESLLKDLGELSEALELRCGRNPESIDMEWAGAVDKAVAIIEVLTQWSQAYPTDIFPEPDWQQVHRALRQVDISGSALAADCMRYVVTKMKERAEEIAS